MPRGGRSRGRSASPIRAAPPRTMAPAPVSQRSPMPTQQPTSAVGQPQHPGLLKQMAATAGGVAIGSAVGHAVGHAITGGGGHQPDVTYQEQPQQQQQQPQQGPCQYELQQFLKCAETQQDLTLCDAFNMVLRDCKKTNGLM